MEVGRNVPVCAGFETAEILPLFSISWDLPFDRGSAAVITGKWDVGNGIAEGFQIGLTDGLQRLPPRLFEAVDTGRHGPMMPAGPMPSANRTAA